MLLRAKYGLEMIWLNYSSAPEVLFSLFINELANEIMQRGRHGIQLIPDLIEIFILLFADYVILVSDTVCGLQNQSNVLFDTALAFL